jgi:two-component system alkaline phosphatase synthesis response regulator PhoP
MIFILEDTDEIRELELYTLRNAGYQVAGFNTGADLLAALLKSGTATPELLILDIMLPDISGIDVLQRIRADKATANVPVIMVTAKTTESDKIKGFDYGADDYISKPFSLIEFLARVRAVLKRSQKAEVTEFTLGALTLNLAERTVTADGEACVLTYKEFELLRLFMSHPERVFSRDVLMDMVWGVDFVGESRTVDMHIKTLRQKIGGCASMIKTIRSVGYKISTQDMI